GMDHAVVYLPETVHYYVAPKAEHGTRWEASHWEVEDDPVLNPLAPDVPVVPLVNRPEKRRMGFGEFEDVLDIQDRINQTALDRLVTGAVQAFRQRWASGVKLEDEDGR